MAPRITFDVESQEWRVLDQDGVPQWNWKDRILRGLLGVAAAGVGSFQNANIGTLVTVPAVNVAGVATLRDLRVPTLASAQALNVNAQGSVQNLNVGTLATIAAAVVAGVGTIRDLRVPTLASAQALNVNTQGSVQNLQVSSQAVIEALQVGAVATLGSTVQGQFGFVVGSAGAQLTQVTISTGTTALANIGTASTLVASMAISGGEAGVSRLILTPKSALEAGVIGVAGRVVGSGWGEVQFLNMNLAAVASQPPVGWAVTVLRHDA